MTRFPRPRQSKEIPANSKAIVYQEEISAGQVAVITTIANNLFQNTFYIFKVDGEPVFNKLDWFSGELMNPTKLTEFIIARRIIEWVGVNNNDEPVTLEVLCDGIFMNGDEVPK